MDRVIVASCRARGERAYHTDANCPMVERIEDPVTRKMDSLPENATHCQMCSGEWIDAVQDSQETDYAEILEDMDPDEVDL